MDTTGAVCGQIAGAFYGESAIPVAWRRRLVMSDQIGEPGESGLASPRRQVPTFSLLYDGIEE